MSIFSYRIILLPTVEVNQFLDQKMLTYNDSTDADLGWWSLSRTNEKEICFYLDSNFKRIESFNLRYWGDDNGNKISIIIENDLLSWLTIAIDSRNFDILFINKIVALSKFLNCYLVCDNKYIVEPDVSILINMFKKSKAFQFLTNPEAVLDSFKEQRDEE